MTEYQQYAQAAVAILAVYTAISQAEVHVIVQDNSALAQAEVHILAVYTALSQTEVHIQQIYQVYAQTEVAVLQTYYPVAQAGTTVLATDFGLAQAETTISIQYTAVSQAEVAILAVYIAVSQAETHIFATTTLTSQAQVHIFAPEVQTYSQAQTILNQFLQVAQAEAKLNSFDYNQYGQAVVWVAISTIPILFVDTFNRTATTAPPFNVGIADTGQAWEWAANVDTTFSSAAQSTTHVDGSALVMMNQGYGSRGYDSVYLGSPRPTIEVGEVWIDFWVPASGDNGQDYYYLDKNWGFYVDQQETQFYVSADNNAYINFTTRSAWYRTHIKIDRYDPISTIKIKIWKVGDEEPSEWVNIGNAYWPSSEQWYTPGDSRYALLPAFTWDYTSYNEPSKIDNIRVQGPGEFILYNRGIGLAQVRITTTRKHAQSQVYIRPLTETGLAQADIFATMSRTAQAHALLNQSMYVAQAGVSIYTTYRAVSQAQVHIFAPEIQTYSQAQVILNQSMYVGQTQAKLNSFDYNQYAQALAFIVIEIITQIFFDDFSRTATTAPPFNVGYANTGQRWGYVGYSNSYTEVTSPIYVDGSSLIVSNPSSYTYASFNGPSTTENADIYFDFYIPSARYYYGYHFIYWLDKKWYFRVDESSLTQYIIMGLNGSSYINITRESWYRIHIKVDKNNLGQYVKAKLWKVGDTEPVAWIILQTTWPYSYLGSSYDSVAPVLYTRTPYYYSASYISDYPPTKLDNVNILETIYQRINYGAGNAHALIQATYQKYSQAQVIINQYLQTAQSRTWVQATYQKYNQSQAFIRKLAGYAQAQVRIPYATDAYSLMVKNDGASHLYGMHTSNVGYNSEYDKWRDEIGIADSSIGNYAYQSIADLSPVGPEYKGILFNYYPEYFSFYENLNELNTPVAGVGKWTIETWVKSPSVTSIFSTILEVFGGSSRYVHLGFGNAATWGTGNYICLIIIDSAGTTYHNTGITYSINTWYHVAVTYNNGYFKVYINGQLTNEITRTSWNITTNYRLNIGYSSYNGYRTSSANIGYDNIAIYPSEVSQNRIQEHYARGKTQGFAQASALINRHWGLASATFYSYDPTPGATNRWLQFAQTGVSIYQTYTTYAQATVRITDAKDQNVYGYAQTVIIPMQGLLRYHIVGTSPFPTPYLLADNGTYSQIASMTAVTDPAQINDGNYGDNYALRWQAWFIADMSGDWWFETASDDGSIVIIYNEQNQLVGSANHAYGSGSSGGANSAYITLVAGTKYKIDVKYAEGGGGDWIQVKYMRPGGTAPMWLLDGAAPWNDKTIQKYWGMGIANALWVERNGDFFVWPRYAQAQTKIWFPGQKGYGQAAVQVGALKTAQAVTQIVGTFTGYRQAVLADNPIVYYPLDEPAYGKDVEYSASSYYNTNYLPRLAADGSTTDGWASLGYVSGSTWWKVSWGTPQTIQTVRITNRPDYTMGSGRIIFSNGTSYSVSFPVTARQVITYNTPASNVTWMRIISDAGGNTNPGFSEIEAFNGDATNLVRFPANAKNVVRFPADGTASYSASSTHSAPYLPAYAADGADTDGWASLGYSARNTWWQTDWTSPQTIRFVKLRNRPGNDPMGYGLILFSDGTWSSVTFPVGSLESAIYPVAANNVTWMRIISNGGGINNPGFSEVEAYYDYPTDGIVHTLIGRGNATWSREGISFGRPGAILEGTSIYWPEGGGGAANQLNARKIPATEVGSDLGWIPQTVGSAATFEFWMYWTGADDVEPFILGINGASSQSFYFYGGNFGFNTGTGDIYGLSSAGLANKWLHIAVVWYSGQDAAIANKIYINGVSQTLAQMRMTRSTKNLGQEFWFGGPSYSWNGGLDEFAIFNYALTPEQILTHYRALKKQAYAQANVWARGRYTATGQALHFGGRQPDGWYHELKYYGQASTIIIVHDNTGTAQAGSLIQSDYGLTRMTWNNAQWVVGDIFSWDEVEWALGQPNYWSGGNLPDPFPGDGNWGMAWSGNFIADVTGTWQFRTISDDGSDLWISGTRVVNNSFGSGHGSTSVSGTIDLVQGNFYTIHTRFGQGGGPWNISVEYKRPADANWYYLTDNAPPWIRKYWHGGWAQAAAKIVPPPFVQIYSYAEAKLNAFDVRQRAQAQTDILQIYRVYAQAHVVLNQHWALAQTRTHIIYKASRVAQSQTIVDQYLRTAQSQAKIRAIVSKYASTKTHIKVYDVNKHAQARTHITYTIKVVGQAAVAIKQTYPFRYISTNYGLSTLGATVTPDPDFSLEETIPENVLDGSPYSVWTNFLAIDVDADQYFYLNLDLGVERTISSYYILPVKYNVTANLQYSTNGSAWIDIVTNIYFDVRITYPVSYSHAITGEITPTLARYWRLKFTSGGDDNKVSIGTFQLGTATTQKPTFAQAQAFFGRFGVAQAMSYTSPGLSTWWGQAQTHIRTTSTASGNAQCWYLPPTATASAQASIIRTYSIHGTAMVWALPPTVFGLSEVHITTIYRAHGNSVADIKTTYGKYGLVRVAITKCAGHAQARALIYHRSAYAGQARVFIGHFVHGTASAFITKNRGFGQAHALIKNNYGKYAQALVLMRRSEVYSQSFTLIRQTYPQYGLSSSMLNQHRKFGWARVSCVRTYTPAAQAMANIRAITDAISQVQCVITIRPRVQGQAEAFIWWRQKVLGSAMAQIGAFKYAQAQARIIAFDVPKVGNAAGYILVDIYVPAPYPASNLQSYLVRYNNQTLPGYAQSEFLASVARLTSNKGAYIDTSLVDYLGLDNKEITLTMLVWEPSYLECKIRVQEAATILRSKRKAYNKLYIQQYDKYYEAMSESITVQKAVDTSVHILEYEVTFEAKPWLISNEIYTLIGTGSIETADRTLSDGGWTPTLTMVSGTDITISGVNEYGEDTGSITISGTVSNYVIDSENFETSDNTLITPKDYGLYVGPGKTTFTITGATSCRIEYHNRWYI